MNLRTFSFILICAALTPTALANRILHDIHVREEADAIVFRNEKLALRFARADGKWLSLMRADSDQSLVAPSDHSINARIDGRWLLEPGKAILEGYLAAIDPAGDSVTLRLYFRDAKEGINKIIACYTLRPGASSFERSATLIRMEDEDKKVKRMEGFRFQLPRIAMGKAEDCTIAAPGPFWPNRWFPEGTHLSALIKPAGLHSAPDAGFGVLSISNAKLNLTLATWMNSDGTVAYHSNMAPDGGTVTFTHQNQRAYRLSPQMMVQSDVQHIEIAPGPLSKALPAYREMAERRMPPLRNAPQWAKEAVILEVYPAYYEGGFKEITSRLEFYKSVGFTVIYLMPHWKGGYSPIDLFETEEKYGTKQDLQALVKRAHELGIKVLFDMVIHGFNEKSDVPKQRPELFVKDEQGNLTRHPAWKSITTDWASPAYQQYMVDLVLHDLNTYNIDGYRVDAQTFKGAGWDPNLPYPAYGTGSASHVLIQKMLGAMRSKKSDAVMLSEVFGPLFYTSCDLVHDNQTEGPQYYVELMDAGKADATWYRNHLAAVYDMTPRGGLRVMFARNHDTSWFYHFNGYSDRFLALDAIHALFAVPEVFAGDPRPKNQPSPDTDPKVWDFYRRLFATRKQYPELNGGEVLLREVTCDNQWVFAGLRRQGDGLVFAATNLGDSPARTTIRIDPVVTKLNKLPVLKEVISGEIIDGHLQGGAWSFELRRFQTIIARIQ